MCGFNCNIVKLYRTLPGKHLDKIAEQMRIHNINALLVIGGFEVRNFDLFMCIMTVFYLDFTIFYLSEHVFITKK